MSRATVLLFTLALLGHPTPSPASTLVPTPLSAMTKSAARIVHGVCVSSTTRPIEVAGARLTSTVYTIQVLEYLKSSGPDVIEFRQIGAPGGGALDLGRLAGLPTYSPGTEYLWLLLPESRVGLTSPAGAGEGAYRVSGGHAVALRGMTTERSYGELREAIRREVAR